MPGSLPPREGWRRAPCLTRSPGMGITVSRAVQLYGIFLLHPASSSNLFRTAILCVCSWILL